MLKINLQLFSGGGAASKLGGGGDAANSTANTYRFTYIDKNGKEHFIDIRGDTLDEAKELLRIELRMKGVRQAKVTGVKKVNKQSDKIASNVTHTSKSVNDNKAGSKIDLSDSPLSYTGEKTGLSKGQMDVVKDIANNIRDSTKENVYAFDSNGKIIYNKEGTGTEVSTPAHISRQESYDIHNHSRGEGVISGTFSVVDDDGGGDMVGFTKYSNKKAAFASAKEGIYYISKRDGFKSKEFLQHMREYETKSERQMASALSKLETRYKNTHMGYKAYRKEYNKIKNKYLVDMHNEYLRNQNKFGYDYGLIKR